MMLLGEALGAGVAAAAAAGAGAGGAALAGVFFLAEGLLPGVAAVAAVADF